MKSGLHGSGKYPGDNWEIDFTHIPKANKFSCLEACVDTFAGCIEAFLCCAEQDKEVSKVLIHEIIPRFGSAFEVALTQVVSRALGIEYYFYFSWRPQSSGKVEIANDIIERNL